MARRARALILAGLALLAAGCGFRPLYESAPSGSPAVEAELAAVDIEIIADRPGQELRTLLLDSITPRGRAAHPLYRLTVELREFQQELAFRRDETATRARLELRAEFKLARLADGAPLQRGTSRAVGSYNILEAPYATLVGRESARRLAVEQIAADIKTRLAVFFARQAGA
ncbi:MAG: hypothetical protein HY521_08475 [Proteobacteria bacterium]|nr:hypothetical protein [Pseudomonadota bacterium]